MGGESVVFCGQPLRFGPRGLIDALWSSVSESLFEFTKLGLKVGDHAAIVRTATDARRRSENLQFTAHFVPCFGQLLAKGLSGVGHSLTVAYSGSRRHAVNGHGFQTERSRPLNVRDSQKGMPVGRENSSSMRLCQSGCSVLGRPERGYDPIGR